MSMERTLGTVARGVRAPIIRQGDDLAQILTDTLCNCLESEKIEKSSVRLCLNRAFR